MLQFFCTFRLKNRVCLRFFLVLKNPLKEKQQNPITYWCFKEALDTGSCLPAEFLSHSDELSCVLHSYWNFLNTQYEKWTCVENPGESCRIKNFSLQWWFLWLVLGYLFFLSGKCLFLQNLHHDCKNDNIVLEAELLSAHFIVSRTLENWNKAIWNNTHAQQQVCDFLYLHSSVKVKGTVAHNVPGKTLNILYLENIILCLCILQPTFDWSVIRMQLVKECTAMNVKSHCCQENKLMPIVSVCLEICIQ